MTKEIYMNVNIVEYGNGNTECTFCESINDEPLRMERIPLEKAQKLMWELVLAGGTKTIHVNRLDPRINFRDVYIFLTN